MFPEENKTSANIASVNKARTNKAMYHGILESNENVFSIIRISN